MPKGALLHAHFEATVDAASLLKMALEHPNVCIRAPMVMTKDTLSSTLPDFLALPVAGNYVSSATITSPNYEPNTYISAQKVRDEWPETLGGPEGFDTWVVQALTINPREAYETHKTTTKIWNKFISCFTVIHVSIRCLSTHSTRIERMHGYRAS
jgi:adenosine deaminase CECR1